MTPARTRVLVAIEKFIHQKGFAPSYEEIAKACGLSSLGTVHKHVHRLEADGYIAINGDQRAISINPRPEIYGLRSCDRGHEKIYFGCADCPLCPFVTSAAREVSVDKGQAR